METWIRANEETLLNQSRSFSIPILNLENRFKIPIMVEYNLNKTIDTNTKEYFNKSLMCPLTRTPPKLKN